MNLRTPFNSWAGGFSVIVIINEELTLWVTLTIGATSGTKTKSKQFPKNSPLIYFVKIYKTKSKKDKNKLGVEQKKSVNICR